MASLSRRRTENAPGEFYVDSTCIDCDTCRWMAPATFDRAGAQSRVHTQPGDAEGQRAAFRALIACPTGSIGGPKGAGISAAREAFPFPIDGDVHHAGWHSESSFGAASYLVARPPERGGNVLVDSPRFNRSLVRRLHELGGVATMFLTHRDDVADHARFREEFGCVRVLHTADVQSGTRDVEHVVEGAEALSLDDELTVIPVPGHTEGSMCLLYRGRYLFSGDHLAWSRRVGHLYAFRSACWYDWGEQTRSMERLAGYDFEWVLPGHGWRRHLPVGEMRREMERCVGWMKGGG